MRGKKGEKLNERKKTTESLWLKVVINQKEMEELH